jgi:anti-sigma factor RsiW
MNPVTEAELHAYVDRHLPAQRRREIDDYLSTRPEEAQRLAAYEMHQRELRGLFNPVLDEPIPRRLVAKARGPRTAWRQQLAAGIVVACLGGTAGWLLRGEMGPAATSAGAEADDGSFAVRAAVAHAVYTPDLRRPVEVAAPEQAQLTAWLSRRMGAPMSTPQLAELGYALMGGRLLPGDRRPVAQFMYQDAEGRRLTLYVSNELTAPGSTTTPNEEMSFRFSREGAVNVFYWVDGPFGYAVAGAAARTELARVAAEVYRQLAPGAVSAAPAVPVSR